MIPEASVRRIGRVAQGSLPDASAWSTIAALPLRRAQDGGTVAQATAVRVAHDGERLLVRFDCDDRDVWATRTKRDDALWEEEVVEVFLAPGAGDPMAYVEIQVNPLGTIFDARVANPEGRRETMRVDRSWDLRGIAVAIERSRTGWSASIGLPWNELTLGEPPPVWRANFFRIERPRDGEGEFSCWSPTRVDPPDFHKPRSFGRLLVDRAGPVAAR